MQTKQASRQTNMEGAYHSPLAIIRRHIYTNTSQHSKARHPSYRNDLYNSISLPSGFIDDVPTKYYVEYSHFTPFTCIPTVHYLVYQVYQVYEVYSHFTPFVAHFHFTPFTCIPTVLVLGPSNSTIITLCHVPTKV